MAWTKQEIAAAREELRSLLKPGETIFVLWRHTSRSGMARWYDVYAPDMSWIGRLVAKAIDAPWDDRHNGLRMDGCGMDMRFALTYQLGYALWPKGFPAYPNFWHNRKYEVGEHVEDAGYALHFRAL